LDSFSGTTGLELSANPHWWGGKVSPQHISIKFMDPGAETTAAFAMRSGSLDLYTPSDTQGFAAAAGSGVQIIKTQAKWGVGVIYMNTRLAPWNDVHVRRAVAYAINRPDIIRAYNPDAVPTYTIIPPDQLRTLGTQAQIDAIYNSLPKYPHSIAKAKAELAKSAYPHGFTWTTDCVNSGKFPDACQVVSAELKPIGINLQVRVDDIGKWLSIILGLPKTYGLQLSEYGWSNPDPAGFPSVMFGTTPAGQPNDENGPNYAPPGFPQLLRDAESAPTSAKRLALYGKLLKQLATDVPSIPEYLDSWDIALSKKFTWPSPNELTFSGGYWPLYIKAR
jgi:peptide/nickel transport system substrate-binding protein